MVENGGHGKRRPTRHAPYRTEEEIVRRSVLVLVLLGAGGCQSSGSRKPASPRPPAGPAPAKERDVFAYREGDGAEAGLRFKEFLARHGLEIIFQRQNIVGFRYAGLPFAVFIETNRGRDLADRLVVVATFRLKKGMAPGEKLLDTLGALSNDTSNPTYYVWEGFLVARTMVVFLDVLPWELFEAFLRWYASSITRNMAALANYVE